MDVPLSTKIVLPVTIRDMSLARNTAVLPMSSSVTFARSGDARHSVKRESTDLHRHLVAVAGDLRERAVEVFAVRVGDGVHQRVQPAESRR